MGDSRWMQDCVREFHVAMDQPAPDRLDLEGVRLRLRAQLIAEEALETIHALGFALVGVEDGKPELVQVSRPNWLEIVDGLCDLAYVTLGTAVEAGFRLEPFFGEVHRSNLTKVGGPTRADGKLLKPTSWEAPRIPYLWDRLVDRGACGSCTAL